MRSSGIFRGCNQKKQVGRFFIHSLKFHPFKASAKQDSNTIHPLKTRMRNCNTIAYACAAEPFPFKKHLKKSFFAETADPEGEFFYHLFKHLAFFPPPSGPYFFIPPHVIKKKRTLREGGKR